VIQVLQDSGTAKHEVDEVIMVGGSSRIPKVRDLISTFFGGKELNHTINPDEAVAHGAAIQAAIIAGFTDEKLDDAVIMDVAPLSLGLEGHDHMMKVLIPRQTPIPTKRKMKFSTYMDNQTAVQVAVYEGERAECKANNLLGQFVLENIPAAPSGVPQIVVTFDLSANSLLDVSALEKSGGTSERITIKKQGDSEESINRMIAEAKEFEEYDRQLQRSAKVKMQMRNFIVHIGNTLKDAKYKTALGEDREPLQKAGSAAIAWFRTNAENTDADGLHARLKELAEVAMPILKRTEAKYREEQQAAEEN
jgi:L1 cell adhesion molecule like protein